MPIRGSVVVQSGNPAMLTTGHPRYADPRPGDRIEISSDGRRCCLNDAADTVVTCTDATGQTEVWQISGPLS